MKRAITDADRIAQRYQERECGFDRRFPCEDAAHEPQRCVKRITHYACSGVAREAGRLCRITVLIARGGAGIFWHKNRCRHD